MRSNDVVWSGCVAVVLVTLFFSCGAGGPAQSVSNKVFGQALKYDPAHPVAGQQPVSLAFWTQVDQEEIYRRLVDDYMALHPNVRIDLVSSSYQDHFPKLDAALNAGIGPDLFHFHNAFHKELVRFMEPYPEATLPIEALEQDFRQVEAHRIDGKLYYLDTGLMTSCIYYSTKAWADAGLTNADIPKTWEQLKVVAKKLTLRNTQGEILRAGFNPNGIAWSLLVAMNYQQAQPMFGSGVESLPTLDSEATRRSLIWLSSLYRDGGPSSPRLPEFQESFGQGTSAMIYGWGWVNNWLAKNGPEVSFETFPLPAWTEAVPAAFDRNNGESTPCVNRASSPEKRAVAFDLIRFFLASDNYLESLDHKFSLAPSKRSLSGKKTFVDEKAFSSYSRILDRTVWPGVVPVDYENLLTSRLVDPVILDGESVGLAVRDTAQALAGVWASLSFQSRERDYPHASDFSPAP